MAVKSSGSLSLTTDIVGEFGGSAPHSLSEYYGGGTYVPAGANPGIATSGQINMGSHYGAVAATVLTISSNTNNYDIGAAAIAAGGDKNTPVILTINAGVTVGSTSSGTAAMYTGTGWGSGTTINITNNGSIVGKAGATYNSSAGAGGAGGGGKQPGTGNSGHNGAAGAGSNPGLNTSDYNGGDAFEHSQSDSALSVIFDTAGTRSGGSGGTISITGAGGGGGGGGADSTNSSYGGKGGCGGGGGAGNGGGAGGPDGWHNNQCYGSSGSSSSGGQGGQGSTASHHNYNGGNGGNLNQAGAGGVGSYFSGTSGGAAGYSQSYSGSVGSALSGNTGQIN